MKKIIFLLIIVLFTLFLPSLNKLIFFNRASGNQLDIKVKLQGEYDKITSPSFKTKVVLYSGTALVKEYTDQSLTKDNQNIFKVTLDTTGLDLNQTYAVFIKPDKYLGKLFCSPTSFSANCKTPQIIIPTGTSTLDLTQDMFFSGDIAPQDGKIAADDISKIAKLVGKASTGYQEADINSDGVVQTVDYSLALYSLSKNYVDDVVPSTWVAVTPTPTIVGPSPTLTEAAPTLTPTPIISTPTATIAPSGGTCKATINGKIYGNYIIGFCSPINNETTSVCVSNASECTVANCLNEVITTSKDAISQCTSGGGTIDEAKSRATLSCQVQFTPGNCIPTPTPAIDCNDNGPSC
ncbi:MAG: hypothetical protein WCT22_00345 [Patescibacteria group bacterium]